jgi:hypothetical protein
LEDVSGRVGFLVEDEQAEVEEIDVEEERPVFAVFKVELGLSLVTGGDPDVEPGILGTGFYDRVVGVSVSDADLSRFLDNAEWRLVENPSFLIREEVGFDGFCGEEVCVHAIYRWSFY